VTLEGNGNGHGGVGFYAASGPGYGAPGAAPPPGYGAEPEPEGMTLRDYLGVLWRRKWIVLLVVAVATVSAYVFSARQTSMYSAEATIIYKQQLDLSNPLNTAGTSTVNLDREIASIGDLLAGPNLQQRIASILEQSDTDVSAEYTLEASPQESTSGSTTAQATNVVVFTGDSSDPDLAAAAANAAAEAYVAWNADFQKTLISKAIPVIEDQLSEYKSEASKLSTDYIMLKQRLQDLQILKGTATGNYQELAPAVPPAEPYAPNPLRSAILGFGVGLFAGIGLAFLLEQFDTRVRRPDELAALLRQPILGRVPRISRKLLGESALVALSHPDGQVAEAFRMVRTNLDFMAVDGDVKSIVLTSCMKGEGKSVTVSNLAVSMAMAGKKIIVVDADLRRPRQHSYFGLPNEKGVSTVATGKHTLAESLVRIDVQQPVNGEAKVDFKDWAAGTDARSALYVLPSGPIPPNPGEIVASRRFDAILEELCTEADLVLVDSPAMLAVGDTSAIAARVDGLVFLADLQEIKRPQLTTAGDQLARLPVKMLGIVVRMNATRGGHYYYSPYYYRYSYAEDGTKVKDRRRRADGGRRAEDHTRA
jgi:Mrp family chromosome partitioning ATPase/capsular polysaccharide biosynthesis protein